MKSHLFKFVQSEFEKDFVTSDKLGTVLVLKKRIISFKNDNRHNFSYHLTSLSNTSFKILKVVTPDSRGDYLFALYQYFKQEYRIRLCQYIYDHRHVMTYSQAIHEFRMAYNIYESEYSFESAYRLWTRSELYQSIKQNIGHEYSKVCG